MSFANASGPVNLADRRANVSSHSFLIHMAQWHLKFSTEQWLGNTCWLQRVSIPSEGTKRSRRIFQSITIWIQLSEWRICIFWTLTIVVDTLRVSTTYNGEINQVLKKGLMSSLLGFCDPRVFHLLLYCKLYVINYRKHRRISRTRR